MPNCQKGHLAETPTADGMIRFDLTEVRETMFYRTLISVLLVLALAVPVITNAERQSAKLPKHVTKQLMSNMRGHLNTLQEITSLLAESRYAQAADTAENHLGMSTDEIHYQKFVGKYMPEGMREIGTKMHKAASGFALSAREAEKDGDLNRALLALSQVIKQCVACHELYRANRPE